MKRLLKIFATAIAGVLLLVGIYGLYRSEGDRITLTADFDDVADLTTDAPVQLADVRVGRVSNIELDMTSSPPIAHVTIRVDRSASVPADAVPLLRRTSVLGEKFIELRPVSEFDAAAPRVQDGAHLGSGIVVSDLEQLVVSGEDLFAKVSGSELAIVLDEGAKAFDGQGSQLRATLDNFSIILEGYGSKSDDIRDLIVNLEKFSATTGPEAETHATALTNLAETVDTLEAQRLELIDLLLALDELAVEGEAILDDHLDEIARVFDTLAATTGTIVDHQDDLAKIIQSLPGHNINLPSGVQDSFVQVLNDVVVCGFPGGGEQDTPVYTCTNKYAEDIPSQADEEPG